ncbi:DoxX-like family protein [Psychromarinibacter halotolerans]|uniref:DoxX-like family protein n=1 Tax=Psychromarinibacter halotolerans TaxID=1775175 RepID=A0ABV7GRJ2_9RHOB|nr:DoxX-like family protein [Psychromarinibacter halotolerans]MDF0597185.1 DoxX-like family protein [Psychromarinibacter halotolerans]
MGGRILLLGADGFIGRHIAAALRDAGFFPLCVARRTSALAAQGFEVLRADMTDPATHEMGFWRPYLSEAEGVVNAAGLLDASEAAFEAVHVLAPRAIYDGLTKDAQIVLISAIGIEADTPFGRWRRASEALLDKAPCPSTILRPGLVMGETSYGGTSLLRAMAAMPLATPVVGDGTQRVNPMHAADLAALVVRALQGPPDGLLEVGGSESLSLADLTARLRGWMGQPPVPVLRMPLPLARGVGRIGSLLTLGPISAVAVDQLAHGIESRPPPEGRTRGASEFLAARPAGTQDLWHARLFLLKPGVRLVLALMWLMSGVLGLFLPTATVLGSVDTALPDMAALVLGRLGGLVDVGIAIGLLAAWRLRLLAWVQLTVVVGYTLGLSVLDPSLWLDPFGALLKNLPILLLILVHRVLEEER